MSEKEKTYLPQSTAGLIRYYESEEGIKLKPIYVIVLSILFGAVVIFLRFLA